MVYAVIMEGEIDIEEQVYPVDFKDWSQWITWSYIDGRKQPYAPYSDLDKKEKYSWSNPENWTDHETAINESKRHNDIETPGFVLQKQRNPYRPPADPFVLIDFDDVRNPKNGEVHSKVLGYIDDIDSYADVSVSGSGIHIYCRGALPEGIKTLSDSLDGDDRFPDAEIEIYDGKRFTALTGLHIEGTPSSAKTRQGWIEKLCERYATESESKPDRAISEPDRTEEEIQNIETTEDVEDIFDAIKHISTRDIFLRSSETNQRSDGTCDYDPSWTTSESGTRLGELEDGSGWIYRDGDVKLDAVQVVGLEEGIINSVKEYPDGDDFWRVVEEIRNRGGYIPEYLDKNKDKQNKQTKQDSQVDKQSTSQDSSGSEGDGDDYVYPNNLKIEDDRHGYWEKNKDDSWEFQPVCNFKVEPHALLINEDDTKVMRFEVIPVSDIDPSYTVEVEAKVFNRSESFQNNVVKGFSTTWSGGKNARNHLREFIAYNVDDEDIVTGTELLGIHSDELVTPQGTLGSDGWKDSPDTIYISRSTSIERKWGVDNEVDSIDEDEVREILELLPNTRNYERFIPVIGWFYASTLRPYLMDIVGEFPHLNVHGGSGSGKTHSLKVLWKMFGVDENEPFSIEDTAFTHLVKVSSTNCVPVWYDEYKPSNLSQSDIDTLHGILRKLNTNGVGERGNISMSIDDWRFRAPVVVSGEQQFQESAVERRSIIVNFKHDSVDRHTETNKLYKKLVGEDYIDKEGKQVENDGYDLLLHAYAWYRFVLGLGRQHIEDVWGEARKYGDEIIEKSDIQLQDTEKRGIQTIVFGWMIYLEFAERYGVDMERLPSDTEFKRSIEYICHSYSEEGRRWSDLDHYMDLFSRAADDGMLELDEHYTFVYKGTEQEKLRFNIRKSHDKIRKYAKEHDLEETIYDRQDYHSRFEEQAERDDSYVETVRQNTPPIARCIGVYMDELSKQLDIGRDMFIETAINIDEVKQISDTETPNKVNIEGTIVESSTDDLPNKMEQEAVLEDDSGKLDVVVWSEDKILDKDKRYRIEQADLKQFKGEKHLNIDDESIIKPQPMKDFEGDEDIPQSERVNVVMQKVESLQRQRAGKKINKKEAINEISKNTQLDKQQVKQTINTLIKENRLIDSNGLRVV